MKEFGLIIKLALAILFVGLLGDYVPHNISKGFYTLSLVIKEILVFCLPFIIFVFIFSSLSVFQKHAPLVIVVILGLVVISNFVFTYFGYGAAISLLPLIHAKSASVPEVVTAGLNPYFSLTLPKILSPDLALIIGVLGGLYNAFYPQEIITRVAVKLKDLTQKALTRVFIPIVPLYILGFLFKLQYENSLLAIFRDYGPVLFLIFGVQVFAVLFSFWIVNLGKLKNFWQTLKTASPSGLVGFSTMSSAATLPLTLEAAEKNTGNVTLSQMVVTATANIHHVGDSVAIPILMTAIFMIYGHDPMTLSLFFVFSMYYMVAKFGVASVPGGEAIILLPILQDHFGFSHEMSGLFTALYMLIDCGVTATNVMCNGAFAIALNQLCGKMKAFSNK